MANQPLNQTQKRNPWAQKCLNWASRLSHPVLLSTIATSAVVLTVRTIGGFQGLELGAYDQMIRLRSTLNSDQRILVVGIDESDIQSRREWPIKDSTLSELLDVLLASEPTAVGLDLFRDVPIGEGHDALLTHIQNDNRVVAVCRISSPDIPGIPPPAETPETQVGFSDLVVDPGGILRRSLLVAQPPATGIATPSHLCNDPHTQLFSLSFQLTLQYLAAQGIAPELTPKQEIKLGETVFPRLTTNFGGYRNIDAAGYQLLINFRAAHNSVPQVSLSAVLSGEVPTEQIRDRIVLIGVTTPEAQDDFYTPYSGGLRDSQKMPGVTVHAQSVSQMLSAVLDNRPLLWSWPTPIEGVWIVIWGLGGALFAWHVRRPLRFTIGAAGLLGILYGTCYVLLLQAGWIPVVPPALSLALAASGVVLLDRFNKSAYGQAVYKQMKSLLRLDIEIDTTRVGQQVAEITETDYFANLQKQARELRKRREAQSTGATPSAIENKVPKRELHSPKIAKTSENMDDYFDNLKREARRLKSSDFKQND
ncbi:MAG: CHASE2 domain-containing protein [Leptolyngbya sp. SIO1D8]|nr:CHASE2 domain-containing protein [Leptolyngbya sp. SIO1D8]